MAEPEPLATFEFAPGRLDGALEFLKRTRGELRTLRFVRVWTYQTRVYDVNGDSFQVTGIGYPDPEIAPILKAVNTAFKPESIHEPIDRPFKQFNTGRRYCWAQDRVM